MIGRSGRAVLRVVDAHWEQLRIHITVVTRSSVAGIAEQSGGPKLRPVSERNRPQLAAQCALVPADSTVAQSRLFRDCGASSAERPGGSYEGPNGARPNSNYK